jgi:hypothetical protein
MRFGGSASTAPQSGLMPSHALNSGPKVGQCVSFPRASKADLRRPAINNNPFEWENLDVCLRCNAYRERARAYPGAGRAAAGGSG